METLPDALKAFGAYPQFILYKLVPASNGKMDKLPVDHRTLDVFAKGSNWQTDPAAKTTFDAAAFLAAQLGASHGVGFFISESDPFFFVDIDNCLRGAEWSTDAMNILRALPGAAIEVNLAKVCMSLGNTLEAPRTMRARTPPWGSRCTPRGALWP
jgi:primase-polymerase (primpol)-like protein